MAEFKEYSKLCREICPPESLNKRVVESLRRSSGSHRRSYPATTRRFGLKLAIAAVLILAFLAMACTIAVYSGLIEMLAKRGLADAETLSSLSTVSAESPGAGLTDAACIAIARDDVAEYRVLEAIYDYNSIYIHFQILPLDSGMMFIDQMLSPGSPAVQLGIAGAEVGTIEEYADSCGKEIRYASIYLSYQGNTIFDLGKTFEYSKDGSLHIYASSKNPCTDTYISLVCAAFTYTVNQKNIVPEADRTEFELRLQNKSSLNYMVFTKFEPGIWENYGVNIEKLVIEETELGLYCTFTYTGREVLFSMVDEHGQYFKTGAPRGSSSNTVNSDGSYCLTVVAPKVEHPEKLMFVLVDGNFDKHGPFAFAP